VNKIKSIINAVKSYFARRFMLRKLLESKLREVEKMEVAYNEKLARCETVYTTVQTYNGKERNTVFWAWVRSVLVSDEYKFLMFSLRESTIRELAQCSDTSRIIEINGQLKMLQVIDNYLTRGLAQNDAEKN